MMRYLCDLAVCGDFKGSKSEKKSGIKKTQGVVYGRVCWSRCNLVHFNKMVVDLFCDQQ